MGEGASVEGRGLIEPGQRMRFLRSFLRHPRQVGSVIPTSGTAVRAMLDMVDLEGARCVVEMGAGTGPHTREILARLGPDATFLAFEIDPVLAEGLEREFNDPRLRVINDTAENIESYLNGRRADVVVSAVPFTSLPEKVRHGLLSAGHDSLAEDGTMLVLQYSPFMRSQLQRTFDSVQWRLVPFNVPPAFLFACRSGAGASENGSRSRDAA
jgi:phospholipid N-methyltransferase